MTDRSEHETYLRRALQWAQRGRGFCAPNPAVGAVVVKDGHIVAEGYHHGVGKPHAEVETLRTLTSEICHNAILYVTLEPCCHYGLTPPCTDLIIERQLQRVAYGYIDPNPQVFGSGHKALVKAGVACEHIPLQEINDFYRSYHYWRKHKRPYVTAKLALSLDGKVAAAGGAPFTLTGVASAHFTHKQRLHADGILTTARTILCDDPMMNVRLPSKITAKPLFIIDRQLHTPDWAKIWQTASSVTLFHSPEAKPNEFQRRQARCIPIAEGPQGLELDKILTFLGEQGLHDVWLEAGPRAFYGFLQHKLLNRAYLLYAPKALGEHAISAFPPGYGKMHELISQGLKTRQQYTSGTDHIYQLEW